jgi:hypothetical protein
MLDHDSDVSELPKGTVQVFSFRVAHSRSWEARAPHRQDAYVPIFALGSGPFAEKNVWRPSTNSLSKLSLKAIISRQSDA